jgi:hypothetical protein
MGGCKVMSGMLAAMTLVLATVSPGAGRAFAAAPPYGEDLHGTSIYPFWAAPGDSVGVTSRLTLGGGLLDDRGRVDLLAEDEGLVDKAWGRLLWDRSTPVGKADRLVTHGQFRRDDAMSGWAGVRFSRTGKGEYRLRYARLLEYDDRTAEDPFLPAGVVRPIPGRPLLRWDRVDFAYHRELRPGWGLEAGYGYLAKDGRRAGLSRGIVEADLLFGLPDALERDTWTQRAYLAGNVLSGGLTVDWRLNLQVDGGRQVRSSTSALPATPEVVSESRHAAENRTWSANLGSTYNAGPRWLFFGSYTYRQHRAEPEESRGLADDVQPGSRLVADDLKANARIHTGLFGVLYHPRPWFRVRLAARLQNLDQVSLATAGRLDGLLAREHGSLDRQRFRQAYSLDLSHSGFRNSRFGLGYRYERSDEQIHLLNLDEYLGGNVILRAQQSDRDQTVHDLKLTARRRLARRLSLLANLGYRAEDVDQANEILGGLYAQGDRSWGRWRGEIKLRTHVVPELHCDAGYLLLRETFERDDLEGAKTSWDADRLFATAAFLPDPRFTLYLSFSIGWEDYDIEGALPAAAGDPLVYNPVEYEARTYRLAPAAVLQLTGDLTVEGGYERVRNRDSVANDGDRWQARLNQRLNKTWILSAGYRRYEFSNPYRDDYRADLYTLSLTTAP